MSLSTTASPTTASLTTASPNTTAADPIFHHVTFQHPDLNHHKPKWLVPVILTATAVVAMLMAVLIYWALKRRAEPAEKPTEEVQLAEEAPTQEAPVEEEAPESAPASSSSSVDGVGLTAPFMEGR